MNQTQFEPPAFAGLLYDASGSMEIYQSQVVQYQPVLLQALRGSAKCRRKALFVYQALFADQSTQLHTFRQLAEGGNDGVTELTPSNYRPSGGTALYAALISLLECLEEALNATRAGKMPAECSIAIITDGENNRDPRTTEGVRGKIKTLRDRELLTSSLVIGLPGSGLDEQKIEQIRTEIGFSSAALVGGSDRQVRRAFLMPSEVLR